jgi:2'-5' RNA ligase
VRVFVALNLSEEAREALWRAATPLRELDLPVKWVGPEGLHVTLKFLGQVEDGRDPELRAALVQAAAGGLAGEGAAPRPLPLVLRDFGAFPDPRRPRVFWAGIDPDPALELLQHRVERTFEPLGFPTEARPFRPHLTLGRVARDARAAELRPAEPLFASLSYEATVVVETLDLMQSTLHPRGAVYRVVHRERLS